MTRKSLFCYAVLAMVFAHAVRALPGNGQNLSGSGQAISEVQIVSPVLKTGGFGRSIAMIDDLVVVSAATEDLDSLRNAGAVYVYVRTSAGEYELDSKLTAGDDSEAGNFFGTSLAATSIGDSTVVAVGAGGGVFVFVKTNGSWSRMQHLVGSATQLGFGGAVAMDGRMLVVAASSANPSGALIIFRLAADGRFAEAGTVATADAIHFLGRPVQLQENRIVAGTRGFEDYFGKIYSFNQDADGWYLEALLDTPPSVRVLAPLSLSDSTLAIGSNDDSSSVFVYTFDGDEWVDTARIVRPNEEAVGFGASVRLTGDFLLITAPYDTESGLNTGAVYVYDRSTWTLRTKITVANPQPGQALGERAVASRGNFVAVGSGARPETVYVFDLATELTSRPDHHRNGLQVNALYPNPFSDLVNVSYSVEGSSRLTITVYDVLGRTVSVLFDGLRTTGTYEAVWAPLNDLPGRYFVVLRAGGVTKRKLVVRK